MNYNYNNVKFKIQYLIIIYIMLINILIGCSTSQYPGAPISNICNNNHSVNTTHVVNTLIKKNTPILDFPKDIFASNQNSSVYQSTILTHKINTDNRISHNRNYANIQKGSYNGDTYIVKRGDTLFYIAWITGKDYRELARYNKIVEPYDLYIGQVLSIINNNISNSEIVVANSSSSKNVDSKLTNTYASSINQQDSNNKILSRVVESLMASSASSIVTKFSNLNDINIINTVEKWYWPTKGKVVKFFSNIQGGNKGIDITGLRGQPIFATASGKVVYSGNALRGYGNLIIIKHNNNYLSAYAHNDTILVHDQQKVHARQKIATMGSTGTDSIKLHFEIRYKGKSVNPLHYISQ